MQTRPDSRGRFGAYGGRFVPETLVPALDELEIEFEKAWAEVDFRAEFHSLLAEFVGRPSPITEAKRLSEETGLHVAIKREDLNHTGAHKINNALGQCLLARRMRKKRIIAETGAGQHGVATATVCALFGLECEVYMGTDDIVRQQLNVFRMKLLGARVIPVTSGTATLKDAMNEAMRDWVTNIDGTFYLIGSVAGPHPYPWMVRELQAVIGYEARAQCLATVGRLPDALVACVGGGSNAAGLFAPFERDATVRFVGVEAAGDGVATGRHAATLGAGRVGVLHGSKSYVLTHTDGEHLGQIAHAHSISTGLDYPGVGPEHAHWMTSGRARYVSRTDDEALAALQRLARAEGIICALETAHAVAAIDEVATSIKHSGIAEPVIIVNLSGRGDKDMVTVSRALGERVQS